jgi:polyhydroxyalkanoate synthase
VTIRTWVAVAGGVVLVAGMTWWLIPSHTDRRLLRPGVVRRLGRWLRSLLVRFALAIIGWPHVVDVFLRTKRAPTATTPKQEVWRDGRTVLWRYQAEDRPGRRRHREPVLLVHSLVTKPTILDLTPHRSLVRALLSQGFDVYLLDWGDVGWRESSRGLAEHVALLQEAEVRSASASGARRVHLVGYCLGATVALTRLALFPAAPVASFAAIAPPVDLSVPGGFRSTLGSRRLKPVLALDGSSCVPASLIREAFHFLRPMALRTEWARLRSRATGEDKAYHDAMARWTWEHRRLPGALFFDLVDLYRNNGLLPHVRDVSVPAFMARAQRDHIVPSRSSTALAEHLPVESVVCPTGHVSMIVGTGGRTTLWPALGSWLARQQPRPARPRPLRAAR